LLVGIEFIVIPTDYSKISAALRPNCLNW